MPNPAGACLAGRWLTLGRWKQKRRRSQVGVSEEEGLRHILGELTAPNCQTERTQARCPFSSALRPGAALLTLSRGA